MSEFHYDCGDSEILNSDTEFLAHYTTREKGIEGVLATQSLRFNTRLNVNDPRESKLKGNTIGYVGLDSKNYASPVLRELTKAVDERLQICCFSESRESKFTELIGQSYCLPNMWAHYAGKHTGMCFLFDKKKLLKLVPEKLYLNGNAMLYGDYLKTDYEFTQFGDFEVVEKEYDGDVSNFVKVHCRKENSIDLFFQKDECWNTEQEYRILIYGEDNKDHTYIDFNSALEGIVLGDNFNNIYLPTIEKMLPKGVVLAKLEWNTTIWQYQLNKVK